MQSSKVPFDVKGPISHSGREHIVPTVVIMLRNSLGQLVLILPQTTEKNSSALQFPQGPIKHLQTPLEALQAVVRQECGLQASDLELSQVSPVHKKLKRTRQGKIKEYYFVFVSLCKGSYPRFSEDLRKHVKTIVFVNDPIHLWNEMADCEPGKQKMYMEAVEAAVSKGLLPPKSWNREMIIPVATFAGAKMA